MAKFLKSDGKTVENIVGKGEKGESGPAFTVVKDVGDQAVRSFVTITINSFTTE